jgi:dTDP-4-dehydrorhamnose reductase
MLGSQLVKTLAQNDTWEVVGVTREDLDLTRSTAPLHAINKYQPDIVVHSAAYTDVDGCESEWKKAYEVNGVGTKQMALACKDSGVKLIYISTDYVFNGQKAEPYKPYDPPDPINEYGKSKLLGELHIKELLKDYLIIRTAWLFGLGRRNFVKTIVELATRGEQLKVVEDQIGSPTYTADLAEAIGYLIPLPVTGIIHVTNQGCCSRYQMAQEILRQISYTSTEVIPISSEEAARPARRPAYSVLDNSAYQELTHKSLPTWQGALKRYLEVEGYVQSYRNKPFGKPDATPVAG